MWEQKTKKSFGKTSRTLKGSKKSEKRWGSKKGEKGQIKRESFQGESADQKDKGPVGEGGGKHDESAQRQLKKTKERKRASKVISVDTERVRAGGGGT